MSPSEADLRAALHDGEGDDAPDVSAVIASARARRARRRTQLLGTVAVAAVFAGGGFGAAQLGGGGSQAAKSPTGGAFAGGAGRAPMSGGSAQYRAPSRVSCPAVAPRYALPGGGSPGQFGSGGPIFDKPASSVVLCGYSSGSSTAPTREVLTGSGAAELIRSLENAAKQPQPALCPAHRTAGGPVALIGVTADGSTATVVTAATALQECQPVVTNGTAIRYDWSPPLDLLPIFAKLSPVREHASPIRS